MRGRVQFTEAKNVLADIQYRAPGTAEVCEENAHKSPLNDGFYDAGVSFTQDPLRMCIFWSCAAGALAYVRHSYIQFSQAPTRRPIYTQGLDHPQPACPG